MFLSVRIRKHERGLLYRGGDFVRLLAPGRHWMLGRLLGRRTSVEAVNTLTSRFENALLDVMLDHASMRDALKVVDLREEQRAIVWKDGRLLSILGPGRYAYWRTAAKLEVEEFSVRDFWLRHAQIESIAAHADARKWIDGVDVAAGEEVLFYVDGRLVERLREGRYFYWKGAGRVMWQSVHLREQIADIAGQEILTADKVTLRVNLVVGYQVTDPLKAIDRVIDVKQTVYRDAQLALRAAVGMRTLDGLLAEKESVGNEVRTALEAATAEYGVSIRNVGLRDLILPGDMRELFNRVIAAEKEAAANLIKRREETAAARSQANTAKLLAENPQLARLKELELLQEILAGAKTTFVFGSGELTSQVRSLIASEQRDSKG